MKKLIPFLCIALAIGLSVNASEKDPVPVQGIAPANPTAWATEGSRAPFYLSDGILRYKIETISGATGTFWGTVINEPLCHGGDIRAVFTLQGDLAISLFNIGRYDERCGGLIKGPLDLPPPLSVDWINEIGTMQVPISLVWDTADAWFHESVNDTQVQGWVPGPNWGIHGAWEPSPTYDMEATGAGAWSVTYYSTHTYPRPGDDGFQYEASFRKNHGSSTVTMGLYFNGDGTMNNCVVVGINARGDYLAFEMIGGAVNHLTGGWILDEPALFRDDPFLAGANVFNMVKVEVTTNGIFNIYINERYLPAAQASSNLSGYVGLAIYDSTAVDHVSCDNMTLSTFEWPKEHFSDRKVQKSTSIVGISEKDSRTSRDGMHYAEGGGRK